MGGLHQQSCCCQASTCDGTSNKCSESGECTCKVQGWQAVRRQTSNLSSAPMAPAIATMPASPHEFT